MTLKTTITTIFKSTLEKRQFDRKASNIDNINDNYNDVITTI